MVVPTTCSDDRAPSAMKIAVKSDKSNLLFGWRGEGEGSGGEKEREVEGSKVELAKNKLILY